MVRLSEHGLSIVMLAAGRGSRMGAVSKLLLPLEGGVSVLGRAIQGAVMLEPASLVVVVQPDSTEIQSLVQSHSTGTVPAKWVANPRYKEGMSTSIAAGIAALDEAAKGALIMLGDMPYIADSIVERILNAYLRNGGPVTIPRYGESVGPPTLFSKRAFSDLERLKGDAGGRQLLVTYSDASIVQFTAEERPPDIDTEEDYRQLFGDR